MTPQSTFMVVATVDPAKEGKLRELLASLNSAPGFADRDNDLIPYSHFKQLHLARFVIIRANTNTDISAHGVTPTVWLPRLAFVGDIDGDRELFFAELVARAEEGLTTIFSHCLDFDLNNTSLLSWIKKQNIEPKANYVNWAGRTVKQVHEEQALSEALNQKLSEIAAKSGLDNPTAVRSQLQAFVQEEVANVRLHLTPEAPTPFKWKLRNLFHLIFWPFLLLLLSPLVLLGLPFFLIQLRRLETSDPENLLRPEQSHLKALMDQEDVDVTNHFNVFGQVKPGRFRNYTVRFLLAVLDYASRHIYRRGYLTRIQTIHFARWVLMDDNKRIYFASNYDGSAESYMDDFINKVAWGINLVFSNGVGYPETRWLIKGGGEYEGKYKKTLRRNQMPSESWYKAYPGLTAVDLARNTRIRQGLEKQNPSEQDIRKWLALLSYEKIGSKNRKQEKRPSA